MENIVIGIEGYVGAGKSSISKELLKKLPNSILFDGGNIYRAIVYALTQYRKDLSNIDSLSTSMKNVDIKELMDKLNVKFEIENRQSVIYVNNKKIDDAILQSKENSIAVSVAGKAADNSHLFEFSHSLIDIYKPKFNVIVTGRDLMKIYPDMNYHFFITASLEERIKRKCIQYNKESPDVIRENIIKRDKLQEQAGFYKRYDKTIDVDVTNCKNAEEGADMLLKYISKWGKKLEK